MNIFRRLFIKCFYCKKKIDKSKSFELQYRAADGFGSVRLCQECAKDLDQLSDNVKELYNDW